MYDVKKLQAEAMAKLQAELAEAEQEPEPWRNRQRLFVNQLVRIRLDRGLTQAELARKAGMQQSTVARLERGHGNPSLHTLLAIAKALNANLMLD